MNENAGEKTSEEAEVLAVNEGGQGELNNQESTGADLCEEMSQTSTQHGVQEGKHVDKSVHRGENAIRQDESVFKV